MRTLQRFSIAIIILVVSTLPAAAQSGYDPRSDNAKAFHATNGLVDGVELLYNELPGTAYQIVQARLIDETAAVGATVAKFSVVDCNGVPISENVYLAWPYPSLSDGKLLPGNQNNEHMIYSTYQPPEKGPLAMYVGGIGGTINSDVIGGLGLPFNRHVSFFISFKKRCAVATPTVVPPTSTPKPDITVTPVLPINDNLEQANSLLQQILEVLRAIARHFGVPLQPGIAF